MHMNKNTINKKLLEVEGIRTRPHAESLTGETRETQENGTPAK